ncbi:hypothetical protein B1813_18690 [Saccharomonospora piscinae]|uniref:Uncharacterized protein n=1 Tax=Saccharomonospora piscinae TaxID=687388 RepID=A0A1V8ZYX4_SACPI|nr:hypothetical protein [Saccharomonospora piscinae]OQO89874.1 hypothetical protein B1813_18690 [Saccharomonospora piscinae]
MRSVAIATLAVVLLCGVTSCADDPGPGEQESPPSPPARTTTPPDSRVPEPVTVRGTVVEGVEPNCLVLETGEREYLLLEAGAEVRPGAELVVRGTPRPGLATTCMQGTPLVVEDTGPVTGAT